MTRTVALLAVLAVGGIVAALTVGLGPVAAQETPANETAEAPSPGAQLSGVVAVQGVEVRGELADRRFGHQVATARSNASRVGVVAERVEQLQAEIAAIRERRHALQAARANGSIGPARFRAEMAALAARGGSIEAAAERTGTVAAGLDRERLRTEARNATGHEAAAIGRSIAGNDVGRGLGPAAGPPGRPFDTPPGRNGTSGDGDTGTLETPTRGDGAGGPLEGTGGGPPERTTGRPSGDGSATRGPPASPRSGGRP